MNQRGWMLLLGGLAALMVLVWWFSSSAVETPSSPTPAATAVFPPVARPPPPPTRSEDGQPAEEEAPPPSPAAPVQDPTPAVVAPSAPPPTTPISIPRPPKHPVDPAALAQESELVDRAKELVREDPELALRTLKERDQKFPDGARENDAELVRVEGLLRLGRRGDAEAAAKKLVGSEPAMRKPVDRLLEEVRGN